MSEPRSAAPVESTPDGGAVETAPAHLRAHLRAVESYGSLGLGVMRRIAGGYSLGDVLEFVGDHMNARDHVDDESIALFERAKAAAAARPVVSSPVQVDGEMDGVALIAAERHRQVEVKGYTPEHDAEHVAGEFVSAAFSYAKHAMCTYAPSNPDAAPPSSVYPYWPWPRSAFKPGEFTTAGAIRDLVKAGALIAAEIDRLRASS